MVSSVVIFGASGATGQCVVRAALDKGLKVRAFVRTPSLLPDEYSSSPNVEVVQGDVLDEAKVGEAVKGVDAVVLALGTRNNLEPTTMMSEGTKNVLRAMKEHGVEPVAACISAFLFYAPEKVPKMFEAINADHQRMYDALVAGDRKYVAVLPPHIAMDAPSAKYITKFDESPGRVISKWDLGKFLVECLDMPEMYGRRVGLCNSA